MNSKLTDKIDKYNKKLKCNKILAVFLYGSRAVGNADESSDIDIIVIKNKYECDDGLINILSEFFDIEKMDISFYGDEKFQNLLECGSLFCHHLKNEATLIYSKENKPKSYYFNKLKEFKGLSEDILLYGRMLKKTKESLFKNGVNYFDLCILGMISRNTLTILAYKYNPKNCKFGKIEVYNFVNNKINFDEAIYKDLMNFRTFYKRALPQIELPDPERLKYILDEIERLVSFGVKEIKVESTVDRFYHILDDNNQRNFYTTFEIFTDLDRDLYFDLKYYLKKTYDYDLKCCIHQELKRYVNEYENDQFLITTFELIQNIIRIKKFSNNYDIEFPRIEEIKNNKIMKICKKIGWASCVDDGLYTIFKEVLSKYIQLRNEMYED